MKQNSFICSLDLDKQGELDLINSIWYSIMTMNAHFLDSLLDPNIDYEDIGKTAFIEKLRQRFIDHLILGDEELFLDLDICVGCNCNQSICKFIGNKSGKHFALYFDIKNGGIKDIYHCLLYGNTDLH